MSFPKPVQLMREVVLLGAPEGGTVLDFFAGSSSMAHAVMQVNQEDGRARPFIMVQLDEALDESSDAGKAGYRTVAALSRERIRRAGAKVLKDAGLGAEGLDVGFRALRVDTTNMTDVLRVPDATDQQTLADMEDSVKPDRTGEDLLFQILIEWGLELAMPVVCEELEGDEVYVVDDGALIAFFGSEVSPDLVRAMARREPLRAVFRDSGFASDDARINAEQIFRELSPATDVKVI
jgi:adenine-specific DNA-methyltransferase